ncbi:DEAD/DEAH box helicase [Brevibacillus fulvus]|uniref:SNF2 family DNA or RNA helicase n=1 Tax=Brevibacillus fulvus TaxID=1125967 RepID=A0A938XRJ8_9BACL|nr:DEAD/DEAH box helicase [Brevibacillus fulvus]MBM7588953.1 SNF2 family DNA or RNA helicase [Brevibacillus fulvus]
MSFQLTERTIKSLCGQSSYQKGEAYRRAGKVKLSLMETDVERLIYEADVKDHGSCRVTVEIQRDGRIAAQCSCSVHFSFAKYCKHVAATLQQIRSVQHLEEKMGEPPLAETEISRPEAVRAAELQLVNRVLDLFQYRQRPVNGTRALLESRTPLTVEFLVAPYLFGPRKHLLGIELRVGGDKRYVVPDIRAFLRHFERGEEYAFSRHFTYDPAQHCFNASDEAIFVQLIEIRRNEKLQREAAGALYTGEVDDTRTMPIPPYAWETLASKLAKAPLAKLQYGERTYDGIDYRADSLPLAFEFDQTEGEEAFRLDIRGLNDSVILEAYGLALSQGQCFRLHADQAKRLIELQQILRTAETQQIRIPPGQMEPFMERVVPGLMTLGDVRIAQAVSERIVQSPLEARIYLDRVHDRLLVGLEFQYGDIVIDPLQGEGARRGEKRILLREGEKEARIQELLETAGFTKTEGSYFLQNEEREYDFLYHVVPQLEKLAKIYATTAVKARLIPGNPVPHLSVDLDERTNWLEFRFQLDGIPEAEIRHVIRSLAEKRKYHRLQDGALLPLETDEFQDMIRFLNEAGLPKGEAIGSHFRLPIARALHLLEGTNTGGGNVVRLGQSIRQLLEQLRNPQQHAFPIPEALTPVLRDYQQFGYQWMKTLAYYRFGGILADDMGLGKTLQSIAFLVSVLPEIRARKQPALIVTPASLMYNWRNELRKFAPDIKAVIADGSKTERTKTLQEAEQADAVIVSYPLLRRDIARYSGLSFHTLILDEAQAFKNYTTQTARAVKSLRAEYKFALTGTPIENSLEELWALFDAVFPGLFPERKAFADLPRETIAKRARPFLLRRLKSDVLQELPEKIETLQMSQLLPEQKKLYAAYLAKLRQETLKHLDEDNFHANRIRILAGLTRLRQLCCHPALFVEDYTGSSAKLEQLLELIEDSRRAGRRLLVFSQFTEMLGLISRELGYRGLPFFYLDGSTPAAERVELCARFNEGERDLFLISLKAGGTGLNLTGADTVVLYDLWWNPAVEQQAEDRAHRIGQKKVVQIIRLVAQGTVEEKMYELQQKKKSLISQVIQSGEEALSALTEQDVRELLTIE